ncbi:hypothetical protein GFS03_04985 [Sulfolobus sp. E5-1-F]|uniref:hypothetical protein n=1 Tax=Saccharolobus sp. E5-1-F TaxID=2663019 RepID=UPI00129682EA|nr:hypothetical protein [Sulfolobus sp. E5-1-F]QGA53976.1 hypothetical protein GFS03_04985 [Sulfolobus sp. E5-1-F]
MQLDLQYWSSHTSYTPQVTEQSAYSSSGNVVFTQTGIPSGNEWVVRIFSQGNDCIARYSSYSNQLSFNLPNGKYIYVVSSCDPLYVTSNSVNVLNVQGSANVSIHFVPAPWAGGPNGYHPYKPINGYQTITLSLYPTEGPEGLSFGAMNSTIEFCVYLGSTKIYSKVIVGNPFSLISIEPNNAYGYVNFNYSGQGLTLVVKNLGPSTGYYAYSLWDYYIDNYIASLITIPPQFALNFVPVNFYENNTGLSFLLKAPNYTSAYPLAIWIGEGYYAPNGSFWWAQVGFNNWVNGSQGSFYTSYAGWGIFSNMFQTVGGTDSNYPLIPGDIYNFTMALISNTTWGFFVNGTPIVEPGLNGYINTKTTYSNGGFTLGFEVLTEARIWSENATSFIPNPVTVIQGMEMKIGNQWVKVPNLGLGVVGENWFSIGTSNSPGTTLFSVQGNIQNNSIPPGELIFGNYNSSILDIPTSMNGYTIYPVYGTFSYPDATFNTGLDYFNATVSQGELKITVNQNQTIVSLFSLNSLGTLTSFKSYLFNQGVYYLPLPQNASRLAISASSKQGIYNFNLTGNFGNYVEEISLDNVLPHQVIFVESGLPNGTKWSVTLNGITKSSTSNTITFSITPGTYSYSISSVPGYTVSHSAGEVTVTDSNVQISVIFTPVPTLYNITFIESGLPNGTKWSVWINGTVHTSTTSSISILLPHGYYEYKVLNVSGYKTLSSGYVNLTHNITIKVSFYAIFYEITFKEEGLPHGEAWTVYINNENYTTTSDSITITLQEGVYDYKIFSAHYLNNVSQGLVNLTSNEIIYVKFSPINYTLIVVESGLPIGYEWIVDINGSNYTTTASEINITLPYGEYEVRAYSQYYVANSEVNIVNLSENTELKLTFFPENFTLTFEESGLPNGTKWSICIDGKNYTTASSLLNITLPYGTYEYRIFFINNNYVPNVTEGKLTLNKAEIISLEFKPVVSTTSNITTQVTNSNSIASSSNVELMIGVIIVIVVIAVIIVAMFMGRRK